MSGYYKRNEVWHYKGNVGLFSISEYPVTAIIGSRDASEEHCELAREIARKIASQGGVVMSGLAKGIDIAAMRAAVDAGGKVIGVIGTSLNRYYPYEHANFQETVARDHLLISPFDIGHIVTKSSFPTRNKLMARLSDVTILVCAGAKSGTKHQVEECIRLGKNVFYASENMPKWCKNLGVKHLDGIKL